MVTGLAFALLLLGPSLSPLASAWESDKNARLHQELSERHFNGVALVAEGDRVVFKEAFGLENFETKEPADVGTAYEVGSVSKPLTATSILLLEERGELSLSDPLTKYFPTLASTRSTVNPTRHTRIVTTSRSSRRRPLHCSPHRAQCTATATWPTYCLLSSSSRCRIVTFSNRAGGV